MLFSSRSRVLWGEAAIEAYQAAKNGPTTLWHEPDITQILDLLDSKLLLQSAKHFPQRKPLQVKTVWIFCYIKRKNRSLCLIIHRVIQYIVLLEALKFVTVRYFI